MSLSQPPPYFPPQTASYILSFQFSSWYPYFSSLSIKSSIIRPLSQDFRNYLDADGIFVPEGSEDIPADSTLSDDGENDYDNNDDDDDEEPPPSFTFPELDAQIRECIEKYGAVFPKLNFSSPKDSSWIMPTSSPLRCTSPSEVYILLKSSDFITHDLTPASVFDGCPSAAPYEIELVLRKWYSVERNRELRCFVRQNTLLAISQRDNNYYDFLNEPTTSKAITSTVQRFWETNIRDSEYWSSTPDYIFDLLLTRDLSRGHILDFNPYAPRTDPLLFTYEELADILNARLAATVNVSSTVATAAGRGAGVRPTSTWPSDADSSFSLPEFRVIDSPAHAATMSNAPAHQHNMVPSEVLNLSNGRDINEFADLWKNEIQESIGEVNKRKYNVAHPQS